MAYESIKYEPAGDVTKLGGSLRRLASIPAAGVVNITSKTAAGIANMFEDKRTPDQQYKDRVASAEYLLGGGLGTSAGSTRLGPTAVPIVSFNAGNNSAPEPQQQAVPAPKPIGDVSSQVVNKTAMPPNAVLPKIDMSKMPKPIAPSGDTINNRPVYNDPLQIQQFNSAALEQVRNPQQAQMKEGLDLRDYIKQIADIPVSKVDHKPTHFWGDERDQMMDEAMARKEANRQEARTNAIIGMASSAIPTAISLPMRQYEIDNHNNASNQNLVASTLTHTLDKDMTLPANSIKADVQKSEIDYRTGMLKNSETKLGLLKDQITLHTKQASAKGSNPDWGGIGKSAMEAIKLLDAKASLGELTEEEKQQRKNYLDTFNMAYIRQQKTGFQQQPIAIDTAGE